MNRVICLSLAALLTMSSAAGCAVDVAATCKASGGTYTEGERARNMVRASRRRGIDAQLAEACISWTATLAYSAAGDRDGL